MVFFSKKSFAGNFHSTFSKTFKRSCQEGTRLLTVSIYKEQEFIVHRSKKKITMMNILENSLKNVR